MKGDIEIPASGSSRVLGEETMVEVGLCCCCMGQNNETCEYMCKMGSCPCDYMREIYM